MKEALLDIPVLYLSRYIIDNKGDYYHYLQAVRDTGTWEEWILYILKGVEETALETTSLIRSIRTIMAQFEDRLKNETSFYRKDLLENLFRHPYTKIPFIENELQVHRQTAATYLNELDKLALLKKVKLGKSNYYLNTSLFNLLKHREG